MYFATTVDDKGIATAVLDLPGEKVNKLSDSVWKALDEEVAGWSADAAIRAVVLTSGKPKIFIAGADIAELGQLTTAEAAQANLGQAHDILNRLEACPKPVVAAVNGHTLGGGLEVALSCHAIVAVDDDGIQMGLPEVKLGLIPGAGGTQRFPRLAGMDEGLHRVRTGEPFTPRHGADIGVVARAVPREKLIEEARALAAELAERGDFRRSWDALPRVAAEKAALSGRLDDAVARAQSEVDPAAPNARAQATACDVVLRGLCADFTEGCRIERDAFSKLVLGEDAKQLIQAFFKR